MKWGNVEKQFLALWAARIRKGRYFGAVKEAQGKSGERKLFHHSINHDSIQSNLQDEGNCV